MRTASSKPTRRFAPSSPTASKTSLTCSRHTSALHWSKCRCPSSRRAPHVKGTTIAELGNRNRPLDMIVYQKDGKDFLLMTNNSRGVMKIPTEGAGSAESITEPVKGGGTKGLGYDTIESLKGVVQMDQLDDRHAVILVQDANGLGLDTIDLP